MHIICGLIGLFSYRGYFLSNKQGGKNVVDIGSESGSQSNPRKLINYSRIYFYILSCLVFMQHCSYLFLSKNSINDLWTSGQLFEYYLRGIVFLDIFLQTSSSATITSTFTSPCRELLPQERGSVLYQHIFNRFQLLVCHFAQLRGSSIIPIFCWQYLGAFAWSDLSVATVIFLVHLLSTVLAVVFLSLFSSSVCWS